MNEAIKGAEAGGRKDETQLERGKTSEDGKSKKTGMLRIAMLQQLVLYLNSTLPAGKLSGNS